MQKDKIIIYIVIASILIISVNARPQILDAKNVITDNIKISMISTSHEQFNKINKQIENVTDIRGRLKKVTEQYTDNIQINQEINDNTIKETIILYNGINKNNDLIFNYSIETEGKLIKHFNEIYNMHGYFVKGIFRQPFLIDSKNNKVYLDYQLNQNYLSFAIPKTMLKTLTFPIVIDPTYDDFTNLSLYYCYGNTYGYSGNAECNNYLNSSSGNSIWYVSGGVYHGACSGDCGGSGGIEISGVSNNMSVHSFSYPQSDGNYDEYQNPIIKISSNNDYINLSSYNYVKIKVKRVYAENSVTKSTLANPNVISNFTIMYFGNTIYSYSLKWINNTENMLSGTTTGGGLIDNAFNITISKINNSYWNVTFEGVNNNATIRNNFTSLDSGKNLSFYFKNVAHTTTYPDTSSSFSDVYVQFDSIEYSNLVEPSANALQCYQANPEYPNFIADNYNCNLNYNGHIDASDGYFRYNWKLPYRTNLTDIIINYRFGDTENISHVSLADLYPECLTYSIQNGTLKLIVFNILFLGDFGLSPPEYYDFNYAYNFMSCGKGTVIYSGDLYPSTTYKKIFSNRKNLTYPYSSILTYLSAMGYTTPHYPRESQDNDFFNTYTYFAAADDMFFSNALCLYGNSVSEDNCNNYFGIAKFYDLSVTWQFSNDSNITFTKTNGTCLYNNAFCSNPLPSGYCQESYIITPCPYCNLATIGENITSDMCNLTNNSFCNSSCSYINQLSCADNYTVVSCDLGADGCLKNVFYNDCSETNRYCYSGSCLDTTPKETLHSTSIINLTQNTSNIWINDAVTSKLTTGTKFIILILVMLFLFAYFYFIGSRAGMPAVGAYIGMIFSVFIMLIASMPDFPIIGGIIPFWLTLTVVLFCLMILIFSGIKFLTGGEGA